MKTNLMALLCGIFLSSLTAQEQTFYVDPQQGKDVHDGSRAAPVQTLEKAVALANGLTGQGSITIKLMPGLYVLHDKVVLHPVRILQDSMRFTLEAQVLPGDPLWSASEMPVIQSVAANNSVTQFRHSTGLLVAGSHVTIRGLKFVGNAQPGVLYYYPITREDPSLLDLEVSQCYFVGEKHSTLIQGGIWAQGREMNINHCVFYGCRNAILVFQNIAGCSITHNIICEAYESALWVGENQRNFEFSNNIISRCHFVWVNRHPEPQTYTLKNSVITDNDYFVGKWDNDRYDVVESSPNTLKEEKIVNTGRVELTARNKPEEPQFFLQLAPGSTGRDLRAGVLK